MELVVKIRINPLPAKLPSAELDELMDGELSKFESWFLNYQRERGNKSPLPLIGAERSILKTFMLYAATKAES